MLLFLGMLILLEVGRVWVSRAGQKSRKCGAASARSKCLFALFGLMVAFTFRWATRFNEKRMLIAEEVDAIENAYLRLHLVPQEAQSALR